MAIWIKEVTFISSPIFSRSQALQSSSSTPLLLSYSYSYSKEGRGRWRRVLKWVRVCCGVCCEHPFPFLYRTRLGGSRGIFPGASRTASPWHWMCRHAKDGARRWRAGRDRAWGGPAYLLLRVLLHLLGLDSYAEVDWPSCIYLVGLLPSYCFFTPSALAYFYKLHLCFWYVFLQNDNSSTTSGTWLVAKVYVCNNM
jgi:hypothetical protein